MSRKFVKVEEDKLRERVRKSLLFSTTQNIDRIAEQLNAGFMCDKEDLVKLVNRMLAFLNEVIKPAQDKANAEEAVLAAVKAEEAENGAKTEN